MTPLAWMDVISTDIERTLASYAETFGWTSEELALDHGEGYRLVRSGGAVVAGAEQVAPERGLAPVWTVMVETDDAPALLATAVASGAEVTFDLAPMLDLGRIAMLRDPWGATVGVWEPGSFRPSAVPDVPGRLVGAVLTTPQVEAASRFYQDVFGWTAGPTDRLEAGLPARIEAGEVAVWTPVLASDDAPAGAGPTRCVDPMGAPYYVLSRTRVASRTHPDDPRGTR
jgi:uncharacterized protein